MAFALTPLQEEIAFLCEQCACVCVDEEEREREFEVLRWYDVELERMGE